MGTPQAIVLPLPCQGHVIPLMELSHRLVDHGFKVIFVNTERIHSRVVAAMSDDEVIRTGKIRLVSIPDGHRPDEEQGTLMKLISEGLVKNLPGLVGGLVAENRSAGDGGEVKCLIYDGSLHSVGFRVARATGIRAVAFSPMSGLVTLAVVSIPKLLEDGIVDADGVPTTDELVSLGPQMLPMKGAHLPWNCLESSEISKSVFRLLSKEGLLDVNPDFAICNSFPGIEPAVFAHATNIHPVGPLLKIRQLGAQLGGNFWSEDLTSVAWLDKQAPGSVVYVAFGSTTKFTDKQFQELALGLEISGRPFLLVARPDCIEGKLGVDAFLEGFKDRVAQRGKVVEWAPQQQVLTHPAIACYVCHGGWNSTMEGLANGMSFLTWPYSADNYITECYVCDVWKTGLRLVPDVNGLVSKEQIKCKIEELLGDQNMRERALELKRMALASVDKGGISHETLEFIANAMKL